MRIERLPEELGYSKSDGVSFVLENEDTEELKGIVRHILPAWMELFAAKNKKYEGLAGNELGSKGKFVDIYRKVKLLKSRIWDGVEVIGEDNEEVILDIIGHAFLMLHDMQSETPACGPAAGPHAFDCNLKSDHEGDCDV